MSYCSGVTRPRRPVCILQNSRLLPCCTFASQGRLRDESAERRAVSRTTLRRGVPTFTVEVRRRPRLATNANPSAQWSEAKSPQTGSDRESHRVAASAFGTKKVDPSPVDGASSPKGRILPSLVPDEPLRRPLPDALRSAAGSEPASRSPKRPSAPALKQTDQPSKPPRNSGFSSAERPPLAEKSSIVSHHPSSVQPDERARVSPRDPTSDPTPAPDAGNFDDPALRAKAKRTHKIATSCRDDRAKALPDVQRSMIETDPLVTPATRVDDRSPQGRKRTIIARYVFGDELKAGDRWKRRMLTTR